MCDEACVFISKKGRVSKDESVHLVSISYMPGTMVDTLHFICY